MFISESKSEKGKREGVIYSFYVLFELKKVDRTSLDILGGRKPKTEPFFWNFSYAQNFLWKQFGKKNELKNSFGILGSVFGFRQSGLPQMFEYLAFLNKSIL